MKLQILFRNLNCDAFFISIITNNVFAQANVTDRVTNMHGETTNGNIYHNSLFTQITKQQYIEAFLTKMIEYGKEA